MLIGLKSILSNTFHHREGCRRPEDVEIMILLKNDFKTVNKVLSRTSFFFSCFFFTQLCVQKLKIFIEDCDQNCEFCGQSSIFKSNWTNL